MQSPFAGKRVPLDGVIYPRYKQLSELLNPSFVSAVQQPAAKKQKVQAAAGNVIAVTPFQAAQALANAAAFAASSTPAAVTTFAATAPAAASAYPAPAAGGKTLNANQLRKNALKQVKKARKAGEREVAAATAALNPPAEAAPAAATTFATAMPSFARAALIQKKKASYSDDDDDEDADEDMQDQDPAQQQQARPVPVVAAPVAAKPVPVVRAVAPVVAAKPAAPAAGNADEAARMRQLLGFTSPAVVAAPVAVVAPVARPVAAAAVKPAFSFGFTPAQQQAVAAVEAATERKLADIMELDSSKDGYVPRRVFVCGMPHEFSETELRAYWGFCGEIEALDCLSFADSGRFNGVCFITFKSVKGYDAAMGVNGDELQGRNVRVERCKIIAERKHKQNMNATAAAAVTAAATAAAAAEAAAEDSDDSDAADAAEEAAERAAEAAKVAAAAAAAAAAPAEHSEGYDVAYVGNITFDVKDTDLMGLFASCGCTQVRLHTDKATGKSKGYAHVHFPDTESLNRALKLDGTEMGGRALKVCFAQPKKNTQKKQ
ncbi:MAG: hypothetical protein WDW38_009371 [Sanguina aurantia]